LFKAEGKYNSETWTRGDRHKTRRERAQWDGRCENTKHQIKFTV